MAVKDNALSCFLKLESVLKQFRIMEMIDIAVKLKSLLKNSL